MNTVCILLRTAASLVWESWSAGVKGQSYLLLPAAQAQDDEKEAPEASVEMPTLEYGVFLQMAQPPPLVWGTEEYASCQPYQNPAETQSVGLQSLDATWKTEVRSGVLLPSPARNPHTPKVHTNLEVNRVQWF